MNPLEYQIIRRARRKTASIIVRPDKTVQVIVPAFLKDKEIGDLIVKKERWITNKLAELEQTRLNFTPHKYKEGECFPYLGSNYRLLTPIGNRTEITLVADTITLPLPPKLPKKAQSNFVRTTLYLWYKRKAREILTEKSHQFALDYGFQPSSIGIKDYKSRWGCCFTDGRIYFNFKIIAAPQDIIDYVIIHELCHLTEPNHSKQFYLLVQEILPDWRQRRKWLKQNGLTLEI